MDVYGAKNGNKIKINNQTEIKFAFIIESKSAELMNPSNYFSRCERDVVIYIDGDFFVVKI